MKTWMVAVLAAASVFSQTPEPPAGEIIQKLKLSSGRVVAEIGGSETLRVQLRKAVGALGKVIVVEIGLDGDPKLNVASADIVLISDSLLHTQFPERLLAYLRSGIKPQGHLFVLTTPEDFPSTASHIENAGFDPVEVYRLSSGDSLLEFSRP